MGKFSEVVVLEHSNSLLLQDEVGVLKRVRKVIAKPAAMLELQSGAAMVLKEKS